MRRQIRWVREVAKNEVGDDGLTASCFWSTIQVAGFRNLTLVDGGEANVSLAEISTVK
jgi:hypothetical protein